MKVYKCILSEHSAHMSLSGSSGSDDELRLRLHKIETKPNGVHFLGK